MKPSLPTLLSINGGYVDTAGFLALHGLFTAHVTGNFVTLGATLALGTSGAVAKLLALPVFCIVVVLARLLGGDLSRRNLPTLQIVLSVKFLLLVLAAILAIHFGPFADGDGWQAILTGIALIAAMAIQTTAHRIHLGSTPPTTMMTGTTTQIMIDIADLLRGAKPEEKAAMTARLGRMSVAVGGFCLGLRDGGGAFPVRRHAMFPAAAGAGDGRNSHACRQVGEAGLAFRLRPFLIAPILLLSPALQVGYSSLSVRVGSKQVRRILGRQIVGELRRGGHGRRNGACGRRSRLYRFAHMSGSGEQGFSARRL